ncbi:MAG: hypothetical protein HKN79_05355 [Flavobacteriales bacterium]|nr:hypothetical protein [Flavobacteriales bacterium]
MRDERILDEHLTRRQGQVSICRKLRFYTLMFTGVMAIFYLVFDFLHWPYGVYLLLIGLISITLQSVLCFATMRPRTWIAGLRMVITLIATLYLILLFTGRIF